MNFATAFKRFYDSPTLIPHLLLITHKSKSPFEKWGFRGIINPHIKKSPLPYLFNATLMYFRFVFLFVNVKERYSTNDIRIDRTRSFGRI